MRLIETHLFTNSKHIIFTSYENDTIFLMTILPLLCRVRRFRLVDFMGQCIILCLHLYMCILYLCNVITELRGRQRIKQEKLVLSCIFLAVSFTWLIRLATKQLIFHTGHLVMNLIKWFYQPQCSLTILCYVFPIFCTI